MASSLDDSTRRAKPRPLALAFIELAEALVAQVAETVSGLADLLLGRLEIWRLRIDPSTQRWLDVTHKAVADGSVQERIRRQPAPQALADELKQAQPYG